MMVSDDLVELEMQSKIDLTLGSYYGIVKLADFGVSGQLTATMTKKVEMCFRSTTESFLKC